MGEVAKKKTLGCEKSFWRGQVLSTFLFILYGLGINWGCSQFVNPMLNFVIWVMTFWHFEDNIKEGMSKQIRGQLGVKGSCGLGMTFQVAM